jgi:hypothetical protein
MRVAISVNYSSNVDNLQYVDTRLVDKNQRYILARIAQQSFGATFRIDYNFTPELSLQYYGSPFASVGRYSQFKTVNKPGASEYSDRFFTLNPTQKGNSFEVPGDNGFEYSFMNPDFAFGQFRSNLVFRWEYLPGSQIYLVWSHERTAYDQLGNDSVDKALRNLQNVSPTNLFLLKLSYWFSI